MPAPLARDPLFPDRSRWVGTDLSFRRRSRRLYGSTQLGSLDQRRTALVVIIFDLAIHALEALGGDNLARLFDRPHRTGAFAQMAGITAFRPALEEIEKMQPVKERQHATKRTQETAVCPL